MTHTPCFSDPLTYVLRVFSCRAFRQFFEKESCTFTYILGDSETKEVPNWIALRLRLSVYVKAMSSDSLLVCVFCVHAMLSVSAE